MIEDTDFKRLVSVFTKNIINNKMYIKCRIIKLQALFATTFKVLLSTNPLQELSMTSQTNREGFCKRLPNVCFFVRCVCHPIWLNVHVYPTKLQVVMILALKTSLIKTSKGFTTIPDDISLHWISHPIFIYLQATTIRALPTCLVYWEGIITLRKQLFFEASINLIDLLFSNILY